MAEELDKLHSGTDVDIGIVICVENCRNIFYESVAYICAKKRSFLVKDREINLSFGGI